MSVADMRDDRSQSFARVDRRRSPRRGKDRRNLATRVPGVWSEEERQRFLAERSRFTVEMVNDDPRRI
jgi:hypothetical protein